MLDLILLAEKVKANSLLVILDKLCIAWPSRQNIIPSSKHALRSLFSFTIRRCAIKGERIFLHRKGFPAILTILMVYAVGYQQRTLVKDVEQDKHA